MPDASRRFPRYPATLRLRLQLPGGELETTTEEISLAGLSAPCTPPPELGTRFGFVLHLPDERLLSGTAEVIRATSDGVTGFATEFPPGEQAEWEAFLDQERASGGLWRMIGRYAANQGQEKEAARSVLERGPLGILFKKIGAGSSPEADGATVVTRLHMVGENGEAFRVAFEKHPGLKPDQCEVGRKVPGFLELARAAVAGILNEDVYLKRSPQAPILPARVVELIKGGFGVISLHPNAPPSLVGLHGGELIAIEIDGKRIFPFFEPADLDRIALDSFRRDPIPPTAAEPTAPATLLRDRFSSSYEHRELTTRQPAQSTLRELKEAMGSARRVQTRSYGSRTIRLFPELWLEVVRPASWSGPVRGFAMEDGLQLCVFVLVGPDAPRVLALDPGDAISIIRGDAQT